MARFIEKQKAINLRKNAATYSEIVRKINVPKSTLSGWLKDYPLNQKQLEKLEKKIRNNKLIGIEKTLLVKRNKRLKRLDDVYKNEREKLPPLTERELFLCGLFLYWGEGRKGLRGLISLNNTDPEVVKFYFKWLTQSLKIPKERIKVSLHLYQDMNVKREMDFWSNYLGIPKNQFIKPYIKNNSLSNLNHKGFGHGTCGLYTNDQYLKEKIILGIKAIIDYLD